MSWRLKWNDPLRLVIVSARQLEAVLARQPAGKPIGLLQQRDGLALYAVHRPAS